MPGKFDYESIPLGYYDKVYKKGKGVQSMWHRAKFHRVAREIEGHYLHLDIGCGPGTFIGNLPSGSHSSMGIDISENQIGYAQEHYGRENKRFETMEKGSLPFPEETFEVITLLEVIEHLPEGEVDEILKESFRVLKPRGEVVVTTPDYHSLWPYLEKVVNAFGEVNYQDQHINLYHKRKLQNSLKRRGFSKVEVDNYLFFSPFCAALSWSLAWKIYEWERKIFHGRLGFLLMGKAQKPAL